MLQNSIKTFLTTFVLLLNKGDYPLFLITISQTIHLILYIVIFGGHITLHHTGYRFFLPLVDDCSRFTWIYMLKHKSDVTNVVPRFFNIVTTQFNAKIKTLRSDNAPELAFTEFLAVKGILHQFSYVERPQQNSVVERKHQHRLNVARAIYFQSRVPIKFWFECVLVATFLITRTSSPILKHKNPYEVSHNRFADYSALKSFWLFGFCFYPIC